MPDSASSLSPRDVWREQVRQWAEQGIAVVWDGPYYELRDRWGRRVDTNGHVMELRAGRWELLRQPSESVVCGG